MGTSRLADCFPCTLNLLPVTDPVPFAATLYLGKSIPMLTDAAPKSTLMFVEPAAPFVAYTPPEYWATPVFGIALGGVNVPDGAAPTFPFADQGPQAT